MKWAKSLSDEMRKSKQTWLFVMTRFEILDVAGSDIPDMAGRKTTRRRGTQAIAKRYAFHTNTMSC